jgi:mannosyltransferase
MKDIVFDNIIYKLQRFGGISTYWFELTRHLLSDPYFNSSFIEYAHENVYKRSLGMQDSIENRNILPLLLERFVSPSIQCIKKPFIFHSSYNRYSTNPNARNVTTVHDLIHHKFYGGVRSILHNYQKGKAISQSSAIIAVSHNTKRDLLDIYPSLDPEKVWVIHNGVSSDYHVIDQASYRYEFPSEVLNEKFIICVSSREPYKNFPFAVEVLAGIPDYKLYIVGPVLKEGEIELLNRRIGDRWSSFTSISNTALNELYNHATAMIYPSSYEGFGIPVLEAMKAGCPTVTLNTSSIPEVAGSAAVMIDELDVGEFVRGFDVLLNNRKEYVNNGFIQAGKFSWDKCYQETSALYRKIGE